MDQHTTKSGHRRERTTAFALRIMRLVDRLPPTRTSDVIGRQLLRSATSVGANYRSACRGRSKAEFLAKLGIVEEEADECVYWIELIVASGLMKEDLVHPLLQEANEIVSMIVASIRTARTRRLD